MANNNQDIAPVTADDDITIELSTKPAYRLFTGRQRTDKRRGILGVPGFSGILKGIETDIRNDDPYADFFFHKIERSIDELEFYLKEELADIEELQKLKVPNGMKVPEVSSKSPAVMPLRFSSKLGFRLCFQLLTIDEIMKKILMLSHIGIMSSKEKFSHFSNLERKFRSVMSQVYQYKHTGVNRDDMMTKNQRAMKAIKEMGELEEGYLKGELRSDEAPPLPPRRLKTLNSRVENQIIEESGDGIAELVELSDKETGVEKTPSTRRKTSGKKTAAA